MNEILSFLYDLQENNNRQWFQEHKGEYEKAKEQFHKLINRLLIELSKNNAGFSGLEAGDCAFRIYRDVRFSKNKEPFKTHFGAYMAPSGRNSDKAGFYIHIQPGESLAGGGLYCPQPDFLNAVRTEIYNNAKEFKGIIHAQSYTSAFGELSGDQLKTAPKGFPKDFEDIALLRYKEYLSTKKFSDNEVLESSFEKKVLALFEVQKPLNEYINKAINELTK
jgi:uncharacterized protein (TIGR02453 family)